MKLRPQPSFWQANRLSFFPLLLPGSFLFLPRGAAVVVGAIAIGSLISRCQLVFGVLVRAIEGWGRWRVYNGGLMGPGCRDQGLGHCRAIAGSEIGQRYHGEARLSAGPTRDAWVVPLDAPCCARSR